MIHVLARIELQPGTRERFLTELRRIVPLVRAEVGCLEYGPAIDAQTNISVQVPGNDNLVTVIEKWSDAAALEAHLVAPHMLDYRPKVKDFVTRVAVQILEPA